MLVELQKRFSDLKPDYGLILGSGLGAIANALQDAQSAPYSDFSFFPNSHIAGHAGRILYGRIGTKQVLIFQGRFHAYEGHPASTVTLPITLLHALKAKTVILTNAAGSLDPSFSAGDIMLIEDHLNLTGSSPTVGPNEDPYPRFLNMTEAYALDLRKKVLADAKKLSIPLKQGVYAGVLGPCYETPAEVRMLRTLGAHAVGMSTVAECIKARHYSMSVLGISCIANAAFDGIQQQAPLSHEEVLAVSAQAAHNIRTLVEAFCS